VVAVEELAPEGERASEDADEDPTLDDFHNWLDKLQ
jgi:hypothetical protein